MSTQDAKDIEYTLFFDDQRGTPCGWVLCGKHYGSPRGHREVIHRYDQPIGPSSDEIGHDRANFPVAHKAVKMAADELGIDADKITVV